MSAESYIAQTDLEVPSVRHTERNLLLVSGAFLLTNVVSVSLGQPLDMLSRHWLHWFVWVACALAGKYALDRWLPRRDQLIFPLVMFLSGWGLIIINRLAPTFADRQALWMVIATFALLMMAVLRQPLNWLRSYRYTMLIIGLCLLIATIVLGRNPSGQAGAPELWLGIGPIFFQPSEALKIILVAFLASYLAEQHPALRTEQLAGDPRRVVFSPRIAGPILLMWGISIVILVWQRDLGTASLFFIVFLILLYVASGSLMILVSGFLLTLLAGFVAYHLFSVVQLRVDIWLNPWPEADSRAYQIVQSLLAFASGAIWGQGIGHGSPGFIPVVHSDFVFAALGEEWGLVGVTVCTAAIATLVARGLRTAIHQNQHPFRALLAVGLSMLIGIQSLMIMAGVLKLIPLTGVTLPFVSYGGSSLLASFVIAGLLLRLSSSEEYPYAAHARD
ncbi:MAG: FtsW/RodA/SpoVE family cell cycle protein [Anaerolineae bacterium]|nr:FtsW/RodA/SpoVE family cell cycle protein [Anaerolineae bacterium]